MTAPPEAAGRIGFLAVPGLLRDLCLARATGRLVLARADGVQRVFLRNGAVVFAASSRDCDRLGEVLLARGMITREQFEESLRQVLATGRRLGLVLVRTGAITARELFRGLHIQVREIVLSLVPSEEGTCRFLEGLPEGEDVPNLRLPIPGLLFEGLARLEGDARFRAAWNPAALRLAPGADPPLPLDELAAPPAAAQLLALLAERRPWAEIERRLGTAAASLAYVLSLFGVVEARPAGAQAPRTAPVEPAPPPAARPRHADARPGEGTDREALRRRVADLAQRLPALDLYQVLGLTPSAGAPEVRRAFLALAREFHPDRFFHPELADLQGPVNEIFMRINEAHATLSRPASRAAYDAERSRPAESAAPAPEAREDSRIAAEQYGKAVSLLNAGDVWSAIQSLRWAVSLSPRNARYRDALGAALLGTRKRLHEAEEHCRAAIALEPANPDFRVRLGQVYRTGRLADRAREQFEAALRLDPRHPAARAELERLSGRPGDKGLFDRLLRG